MRVPAFLVLACLLIVSPLSAQAPADYIIPLEPASERTIQAHSEVNALLADIVPQKNTPSTALIKGSSYIQYGNLFGTGENYALVETSNAFALSVWKEGQWRLRGLWDIWIVWRPSGWKETDSDYLPITPATRAFELKKLSGNPAPEVVVSGEVDKYFQEFYLFSFSLEKKNLQFVGVSRAIPEKTGPFVCLYDNSGRRAIWGEWTYYRWKNSGLSEVASWHDETPYYGPENPFIDVQVFDKTGKVENFRITDAEDDGPPEQTSRVITRDGTPYATVTFVLKSPHTPGSYPFENSHVLQYAWLFHHLTGLPRNCYPSETKNLPPFEKFGTVQVTGTPEAVKRLSGRK